MFELYLFELKKIIDPIKFVDSEIFIYIKK